MAKSVLHIGFMSPTTMAKKQVKGVLCAYLKSLFTKLFTRYQSIASCFVGRFMLLRADGLLFQGSEEVAVSGVSPDEVRRDFNLLPRVFTST